MCLCVFRRLRGFCVALDVGLAVVVARIVLVECTGIKGLSCPAGCGMIDVRTLLLRVWNSCGGAGELQYHIIV